jgi:hypothetical protein
MREGLARWNDREIVLHGRVVDQFGSPVASADVAGSVRVRNASRVGVDRFSLATDAAGSFEIKGYKGESLGVWVSKKGYALATTNTLFIYSLLWPASRRFTPDAAHPVVIRMWKLQGAEPLLRFRKDYRLPHTDAPVRFDLLAGRIVPSGGDLQILVSRSPGDVSERTERDWGVRVEAVDGGLMDSRGQERVTYAAPGSGYQDSMTFLFSTNSPHGWSGGFTQGFFLMSRNGQVYSKVGLTFGINQKPDDPMYVTLSGIANTNGSRNWEGDPNTLKAAGR